MPSKTLILANKQIQMSTEVRALRPQALWNHFADLNAVPRASKKEEQVIQFMVDFGNGLGLETKVDDVGNVIIKKPATAGMEDRQIVVLQSHLDMVHQKNADTNFDFATEGIKMIVEDDWVKADGTTLGADNGIGVATIMAVLASKDMKHPPIEALFTIDEETGMTGALGLTGGHLDATIMLNLDTEDDDELTIGCAGGVDVTAEGEAPMVATPANTKGYKISVKGLTGGHSGMDIHKGRANANKLMNRLLLECTKNMTVYIGSIDGGGLRNAIPRESFSIVAINETDTANFESFVAEMEKELYAEYKITDPNIKLVLESHDAPSNVLDSQFIFKLLRVLYTTQNGIYRMSPDIKDLVQTSNNLARVLVGDGNYTIMCLTRSSMDTEKDDLKNALSSGFELLGANVSTSGEYPGWEPKPDAPIIKMMTDLYVEMFDDQPHVNACHAGLECGILGTNYPNMDMISFGPNIRGAHSPDEKVQISSVHKYWKYFTQVLERTPKK